MEISSIQESISIIIFSLGMGFLTYYLLNDLAKKKKKIYMGEIVSQLINLIIFMWLGKIILNFTTFITDPLAILSYPSNSHAFYVAILFSAVTIMIQYKRGKIDAIPFTTAFIHVFLAASFVYEFMQVIWNKNTYSIGYMGLIALLMIVFIVMQKTASPHWLSLWIVFGWAVGSLGFAVTKPIMMVFGYTMAPWFLVLILLICLLLIVDKKKKVGARSGWN